MKVYKKQRLTLIIGLALGVIGSVALFAYVEVADQASFAKLVWMFLNTVIAGMCAIYAIWLFKLAVGSATLTRGFDSMGIPCLGGGFNHGGRAFMFLLTAFAFGGTFACIRTSHIVWTVILQIIALIVALITATIEFEE